MTRPRPLLLVSLASLGWAFSFGLGAPLAALWMKQAGHTAATVGLNTSLYYLGVAVASLLADARANHGDVDLFHQIR